MPQRNGPFRAPFLMAACLTLGGCASITVLNPDGAVEVRRHGLALEVATTAGNSPQVVSVSALGLVRSDAGHSIGLRSEQIVVLPAGCHAVLIVRTPAELAAAAELANLVERRCVAGP